MRSFSDLVTIARVVKPQGRKGEILVEPLSDRKDRFANLRRVYLPASGDTAREVAVTAAWPHRGRQVLKLEGIDSIDGAEALRGVDLRIGEEDLAALPEGEYYYHQLRGLRIEDGDGRWIGEVVDILETGATPVLVVNGPEGEKLLPLAESFVRLVDINGRRIVASMGETVEC